MGQYIPYTMVFENDDFLVYDLMDGVTMFRSLLVFVRVVLQYLPLSHLLLMALVDPRIM